MNSKLTENLVSDIAYLEMHDVPRQDIAFTLNIPIRTYIRWISLAHRKGRHKNKLIRQLKRKVVVVRQRRQRIQMHQRAKAIDDRMLSRLELYGYAGFFDPRVGSKRKGRVNPNRDFVTGRFMAYPRNRFATKEELHAEEKRVQQYIDQENERHISKFVPSDEGDELLQPKRGWGVW